MASSFSRPSARGGTETERLLAPVMGYGSGDLNGGCHGSPPALDVSAPGSQPRAEEEEEALRRKLKYFFMSPCDKYHAKGRKPYKLALQLLKIIIVTVQLVLFGLSNQMVVAFKEENTDSFRHLFLRDYVDDSAEPLCIHTQRDVYDHIEYAIEQVLSPFGFGDKFISMNRLRYNDATCMIKIAGGLSVPVKVNREEALLCYGKASSAKVNWGKSSALWCGQLGQGPVLPGGLQWEPPEDLVRKIQQQLVDFFWSGQHWLKAPVLYLPIREGGQGLVDINSRIKAFRLQTVQRLLYGEDQSECFYSLCLFFVVVGLDCIGVNPPPDPSNPPQDHYKKNGFLSLLRLINVTIQFQLKAINIQTIINNEIPDCYTFSITILFDNKAHSGKVKLSLLNKASIKECSHTNVSGHADSYARVAFDVLVAVVCGLSLVLCGRSILRGIVLQHEFVCYFRQSLGRSVSWGDRLEFINGWYLLLIISDVLTIIASFIKIAIETKNLSSYDVCSILMGTSTLLVWVGVLRYFSFFQKYNILIVTLRAAFPSVIRFCSCAAAIYLGYCFCGWIVLGPYHAKFRSLSTVSECLFSLINGDDMFATFSELEQSGTLVWVFSQVYLYTFISLFIYMVLSLFIALITGAYDTITQQTQDVPQVCELHRFIAECTDTPTSGNFHSPDQSTCSLFCCFN
ncbi:mucolipin-1b [Cyprinus carpio]|uniref:Mucolipin-1b n=1 Tax=Cyprinus carpio TaxID=7962 RepID=A0A9Q9W571_CYPCA|nr:mucolipin-1b [Cyprinus carpio]